MSYNEKGRKNLDQIHKIDNEARKNFVVSNPRIKKKTTQRCTDISTQQSPSERKQRSGGRESHPEHAENAASSAGSD